MTSKKQRIDKLMVDKGMIESRNKAQRLVMAGEVFVDGELVHKPSDQFAVDCTVTIANKPKYVSRGGLKLEKALEVFDEINVTDSVCADIGASTGGFTDCLLQYGAKRVYAIDVGYGQLHIKLREHHKVIVMERTNIKAISKLPEEINLAVVDVSFISLKRVFPVIKGWNIENVLHVIALIKPQFEVGRKIAAAGKGVIRHEKDRKKAIKDVRDAASESAFKIHSMAESPMHGPKGNIEYLLHLSYNPKGRDDGG